MNANEPTSTPRSPATAPRRRGLLAVLRTFGREEGGIIVVMLALMMPILIGFLGLGVEVGYWFQRKRDLQSMADAAAIGGAYEVMAGGGSASVTSKATAEATRNGYVSATDTINVYYQYPITGAYTADGYAVQVVLARPVTTMFAGYFFGSGSNVTVNAKATATLGSSSPACMLSLATSGTGIAVSGTGTTTLTGCSVAANSSSSSALTASGSSTLSAACASVVGGSTTAGGGTVTTSCTAGVKTGTIATPDPYEAVTEPVPTSCDHTNFSSSGPTISPGTYCKGIDLSGTVEMQSGVYIVDGGTFKINAGATVTSAAGGVTIFLTKQLSGPQYADVTINGGATIDLKAQTSGSYAGILFYQDDDTPSSPPSNNTFNGGADVAFQGALYFPAGNVTFNGGASTAANNCMQIVAQTVALSGNQNMNVTCSGSGMSSINPLDIVQLVE